MKLKEKFDSIDQSKLNADQKDFLSKIEKATKNFTSDNKEVNDKVEGALDKMIATFKEKMPEAIKTKAEKKEPKATAKKTSTKATAKPSQTSNPKRTVMSVAKEIRKDGESWADAQKRARAEMKKDKDSATKEVKTEMNKLLAFIKTRKELDGISGTDLKRDSVREAKPRGRRISKDGNIYYENRENRIDRLSPNYPKDAPMLENGGQVVKPHYYVIALEKRHNLQYGDSKRFSTENEAITWGEKQFSREDVGEVVIDRIRPNDKGGVKIDTVYRINNDYPLGERVVMNPVSYKKGGMLSPKERYNLEIKGLTGVSVGAIEKYIDENNFNDNDVLNIVVGLGRKQLKGADVSTAMVGKKGNAESKKLIDFVKDNKAMKMELGGNTNKYKVGQKFYDTRYDRVSEIVPSSNDALITFVRYNKSGTEMDMSTKQSLVKSQFDYLVNMGAYQIRNYELGGTVVTDLAGHTGGSFGGDPTLLSGVTGTQYSGLVGETGTMSSGEMFMNGGGISQSAQHTYMIVDSFGNPSQHYSNGGTVVVDLAGHTGAGDGGLNADMPLSGITGTQYSGLVGETGTMSSGEMFENGGGVGEDYYEQLEVYVQGDGTIYSGTSMKKAIQSAEMYLMKNPDAEIASEITIVDIKYGDEYDMNGNLIDEYRNGGALTNDRRHVNYNEDYEVRYAKANPNKKRHGYGNLKFYDGGEFQTNVYANGGGIEKMRTLSFKSKEIAEKNRKELVDYFGDRILNSSISKGIDERGNDGFYVEYDLIKQKYSNGGSLENHGIKEGDTFIKTISGGIQKVKDKNGKIVFINLATGERDSQPPLPFNDGGKVPEFIVNKDGIRVSKMVEPKKKLTEKEWMAKYSESKEARAYADGGGLLKYEQKLERRLKFINEDSERIFKNAPKEFLEYPVKDWDSIGTLLSNIEIASNLKDDESDNWKSIKFSGLNSTEKLERRLKFINEDSERIFKNAPKEFLEYPVIDWDSIGTLLSNIEIASNLKDDESDNWKFNNGGEINAFSMRMVKGTNSKPDEVLTENQEVKFAKGGSLREKRNDYLSKLSDKEADIWDKIGANSGTKIRGDKKMLKAYAEGVEEMLIEENVQGRSFDQEDYDFYTDQNSHLFNEFLVWNGYYKPEMTVVEKKWREKAFKEGNIYVSDPEVIFVKGVSSSEKKSKNYILNSDIKSVTVNQKGIKYTFKGSDVLNGANILEKGNVLETKAIYIPKRDVISVELKNGSQVKPSNGYWIKKDASGEIFKPKSEKTESKFEVGDFVYNKRTKTIGVVRDVFDKGEVRTDADGVVNVSEITIYKEGNQTHRKAKIAPSTQKELEKSVFKEGGKLKNNDSENEDCDDDDDDDDDDNDKAEKGAVVKRKSGNPKMKEAMVLAKKIRKDGEKWTDAVKRAYAQVK